MVLRGAKPLLCAALLAAAPLAPLAAAGEHLVAPAQHAELGEHRLFTSAAERNRLDRARTALDDEVEPPPTSRTPHLMAVKKPLPKVKVQGIVKRSSGEDTVWVNGASLQPGQRRGEIAVRSARDGRRAQLLVSGERAIHLKPGQTFDPADNRISDRVLIRKGP